MPQPRVLILRAPGVNCDLETAHAFQKAGAATEPLHVQALLERPARVREFQVLCLLAGAAGGLAAIDEATVENVSQELGVREAYATERVA